MRPLYFDHPADPRVWAHPLQWMLGPDLLVAPVIEPGATVWDVYLPAGESIEARSGGSSAGGRVVTAEVSSRTSVPLFVRAAAWPALSAVLTERG